MSSVHVQQKIEIEKRASRLIKSCDVGTAPHFRKPMLSRVGRLWAATYLLLGLGLLIGGGASADAQEIMHDGITYSTVTSPDTGRVWLDRNLGATQVATSSTDADSYGDYYQWGRAKDGHQSIASSTTTTLASAITPDTDTFIISQQSDWTTADGSGASRIAAWADSGANDICPSGFSVPTEAELKADTTEASTTDITNTATAFSSFLKIPAAGHRSRTSGNPTNRGTNVYLWSRSIIGARSLNLVVSNTTGFLSAGRARGASVRCIGNDTTARDTAIAKLEAYADANGGGEAPTVQDYEDAGVSGVTVENLDQINDRIAKKTSAETDTTEKIQTVVNTPVVVTFTIDAIADATVDENQAFTGSIPSISGTPMGTLTYSLGGIDADDFTINTLTGVIAMVARNFERPVDADTNNAYLVTIIATDSDGTTDTETQTVTVTDVFESTSIRFNNLIYKTLQSADTGEVWLDRNLGATQVATSRTDSIY